MAGWVLQWLSAVRTRLRQRLDLLLEFIVLHHQLAVLQRTGTRRPCFRPSERLFWVPATVLRWRRRGFWAIWVSGSRPPRLGAPSCGTRQLGSVRSVLAKQVGYQTSFLSSSKHGSSEPSAASPRCGMASLLGLWSHRRPCTDCGHIALPIVLIGVSFMVVACGSVFGPPLSSVGLWPIDDFHRIARGHHRDGSCQHSQLLHDNRYRAHA
jgi:hypothetical protein